MVFDIIDNLPTKIKTYLYNHRQRLIVENDDEARFLETEAKYWGSFSTPIKNDLIYFLKEELIDYTIDCFHCTRLRDKDTILTNGLNILQVDSLSIEVLQALKECLSEDTINIARDGFQNYRDGERMGFRENMVWFIGNEYLLKDKGCDDFFRYFGGEITRRVLKPYKELFYHVLEKIGNPYLIHCEIPLVELTESHHYDNLINNILDSLTIKDSYIDFEFYLKKNIPPHMIKEAILIQ